MRNMDSRERYKTRIAGLLRDAVEAKAAQERNDQIQALNMVDDVLGPRNWEGWENSEKQTKSLKLDDALSTIRSELKHRNVQLLLENQRPLESTADRFGEHLGKTMDKDLVKLFEKGDAINDLKRMSK